MTRRCCGGSSASVRRTRSWRSEISTSSSGRRPVGRQQLAQRRRVLVADGALQARHDARDVAQLRDLLGREAGRVGDLVVGRVVPHLRRQLPLHARDHPLALGDVGGQADGAPAVGQAALDGLADPQGRVGGEAEALAPVELLGGADEAQDALLDEVEEAQLARVAVLAGDGDDEAQVRVDEVVLGREVAALDALGQLDLLRRRQQPVAAGLVEEELQRVGGVVAEVAELVAGRRGVLAPAVLALHAALLQAVVEVGQALGAELVLAHEVLDRARGHAPAVGGVALHERIEVVLLQGVGHRVIATRRRWAETSSRARRHDRRTARSSRTVGPRAYHRQVDDLDRHGEAGPHHRDEGR